MLTRTRAVGGVLLERPRVAHRSNAASVPAASQPLPLLGMMVAWNLFAAETRDVFRAALPIDDATRARGRGWALSVGLIALPYYQNTNPVLAGIARYAIAEAFADYEGAALSGGPSVGYRVVFGCSRSSFAAVAPLPRRSVSACICL